MLVPFLLLPGRIKENRLYKYTAGIMLAYDINIGILDSEVISHGV